MTSKVLMLIDNSDWLDKFGDFYLYLENCKYVYEVYERVFVNVAASGSKTWKDVYFARETQDQESYALLIISLLIIEKTLKSKFDYNEESMQKLLGSNFSNVLGNYRDTLEKNL